MAFRSTLVPGLLAIGLLSAGAVRANVLYDNGPYNGQISAPNITSGNYAIDSFKLGASSTVNGVEFVAWDYLPSDTTATISWEIFSGLRQPYMPGVEIASGVSPVTNTFLFDNKSGYGVYSDTFAIPSLALPAGNYSLSLYNAVGSNPNYNDQIYWDTNFGPSTALIHTNFGPFEANQPSQSFQVLGSIAAAPEPSTWALMLVGLAGIGGMMRMVRRKHVRKFAAA